LVRTVVCRILKKQTQERYRGHRSSILNKQHGGRRRKQCWVACKNFCKTKI